MLANIIDRIYALAWWNKANKGLEFRDQNEHALETGQDYMGYSSKIDFTYSTLGQKLHPHRPNSTFLIMWVPKKITLQKPSLRKITHGEKGKKKGTKTKGKKNKEKKQGKKTRTRTRTKTKTKTKKELEEIDEKQEQENDCIENLAVEETNMEYEIKAENTTNEDMDSKYGACLDKYWLRPKKAPDNCHMHIIIALTQYLIEKELKKFREAGKTAITNKL
jgi:hypothetical protein